MKFNYIFSAFYLRRQSFFILLLLVLVSCKKAIDIGPSAITLTGTNVYSSDGSAVSVVSGLFSRMATTASIYSGSGSVSLLMGLSADELVNFTVLPIAYGQYYSNTVINSSTGPWGEIYAEIYVCNTIIKGLSSDEAASITPAVRSQLLAETKFLRAFIYFYATNLYGDVPLLLTNDYLTNSVAARSPKAQVYQQILKDLADARPGLADNKYVTATGVTATDRARPNQQTVTALLARVHLYLQNWQDAETQSTAVIGSSLYRLESNLNSVFLKTSAETIWQLQSVVPGVNNSDASFLVLTRIPGNSSSGVQLPLQKSLVSAFETTADLRFVNWVGKFNAAATPTVPAATYYYAFKYKAYITTGSPPITENPIMFRLAEQYLIRAEARAQLGNITGARADLNAIRTRAGLAATTAATKDDLLTAIAHERQVELFTELGHRWFDLKRTGKIDAVMTVITPQKGGVWNTNKQLLPLPATDLLADANLVQNPGY